MKVNLAGKIDIAKDTKSFIFEPTTPVTWRPGQYFYFTLPELHYPDDRGPRRQFTISSSPTEGKMVITTRLTSGSGFKRTLDELALGSEIQIEGPNGLFILDEEAQKEEPSIEHVFIAGGIGITPFRSIMKYHIDKFITNVNLHLIYANSTIKEIAFREEFEKWIVNTPNIRIDMTVSHPEESQEPWSGLVGRIDENLINQLISQIPSPTFWLCGPPPMVDAIDELLAKMGIPTDRRKIEKFTGY